MALSVRVEPVGQTSASPFRLGQVDLAEAHRVSRPRLREEGQVGGDHGRNHRVAPGRWMIGQAHDQLAGGRDLDRPGAHRDGSNFVPAQPETGCVQSHAHPIELRGDPTGDGRQPLEGETIKSVRMRTADDANLPWTAHWWAVTGRPGRRQRLSIDQGADAEAIARGQRPAEAATESPTLTERPATKDDRYLDPASDGKVGS